MVHEDIRIPFEFEGRRYEAVGFLGQGEGYINGYEILKRVPDAIGEEDFALLFEHGQQQFPVELDRFALVTASPHPCNPNAAVSCFCCPYDGARHAYCGWLGRGWGDGCLVVRRIREHSESRSCMVHEDIRIPFEFEGRRYEAVGFLRQGEGYVLGDEMLRRVPDAIGDEDWMLLLEYRHHFPAELERFALVTASPCGDSCHMSCSYHYNGAWCRYGWGQLDRAWRDYFLVVRRCA